MKPKISPLCQTFHTFIKKKSLWLLLFSPATWHLHAMPQNVRAPAVLNVLGKVYF